MKKALLTAIIFTYNHKKSISKCIESLVNQKTSYPYEIHIWDDCSTDGTSKICRKYAIKYPDKIKLTVQPENTFLKPYLKLQSYAAIKAIKTPYFCIIDGDDYWCDKNKIQIALDVLEKNPQYIGFAHDTLEVHELLKMKRSYIHEAIKCNLGNHVEFSADAPFFLTSSRIFRTSNYVEKKTLPIDYLFFYYHLAKGPIYYYDKIMAAYVIGESSTFATAKNIKDMNGMFPYKLSLLFDFKRDDFCLKLLKLYDARNGVGVGRYYRLCFLKKIFGIKLGWRLWFFLTFVWKYGLDSMNINYVYSRAIVKNKIDNKNDLLKDSILFLRKMNKKVFYRNIIQFILDHNLYMKNNLKRACQESLKRKNKRIAELKKTITILNKKIENTKVKKQ